MLDHVPNKRIFQENQKTLYLETFLQQEKLITLSIGSQFCSNRVYSEQAKLYLMKKVVGLVKTYLTNTKNILLD